MQARILNQSEEHLWSEFVENHPLGNIHQTPQWGHFRSQGKISGRRNYWIIVLEEPLSAGGVNSLSCACPVPGQPPCPVPGQSKILAGTLLVRHELPHGYCWLYAPRGPLLAGNHQESYSQMSALLDEIKKIAKREKAIFLRVDPLISITESAKTACVTEKSCTCHDIYTTQSQNIPDCPYPPSAHFHFPCFRQNIQGFQPNHTLILDLCQPESALLAQMKPKGRYNIKLAEKKGVTIRKADLSDPQQFSSDLSAFYQILTETTSRDGFHGHNEAFYRNMLESLSSGQTAHGCDMATLYLAEFEGKIIAGALNTFHKYTATYYYGASSNNYRNVMAPYLLHWHAIREAKANHYKFYDFFGIAPAPRHDGTSPASPHPWDGVTEFKKKFGGTEVSYQLPQEFVFKKGLYHLYRLYKNIR